MTQTVVTIPAPPAETPAKTWPGVHLWAEKSGFSFHDLLDTINPLQHIPVIGTIYRAITGDEPGAVSSVLGDALFGGVWGLAGGLVNVLVKADTGEDIGEHVMAMLGLEGGKTESQETAAATASGSTRKPIPLAPGRYILPTGPGRGPVNQPAVAAAASPRPNPDNATAGSDPKTPAARLTAAAATLANPRPSVVPSASLVNRPVPLELTGMLLPEPHPRAFAGPPAGGLAPPAEPAAPVTAAPPNGAAPPAGLPGSSPIDISEKMSEALDKYARMTREQDEKSITGGQVNLMQ